MGRNVAILLTVLAVGLVAVHVLPILLFCLAVGWALQAMEKRT